MDIQEGPRAVSFPHALHVGVPGDHPHHPSVLLFDKKVVILFIRPGARKINLRLSDIAIKMTIDEG
jgi:hypothetical protein